MGRFMSGPRTQARGDNSRRAATTAYADAVPVYGLPMQVGVYYHDQGTNWAETAAPINFMTWTPVIFARACTLDRIGIQVQTAGSASVAKVGLYSDDGAGFPSALLLDVTSGGTIDTTSTGAKVVTVSQAVAAATRYWLGVVQQGTTPAGLAGWQFDTTGACCLPNSTPNVSVTAAPRRASVSGALPNPASPDSGGGFGLVPWPAFLLRASA